MDVGKTLVMLGLIIAAIGLLISLGPNISWPGKLPGDIYIKRENFRFYFPLTTSILISILLTLLLNLFRK